MYKNGEKSRMQRIILKKYCLSVTVQLNSEIGTTWDVCLRV